MTDAEGKPVKTTDGREEREFGPKQVHGWTWLALRQSGLPVVSS